MSIQEKTKMFTNAITVFGTGAGIVYFGALYYCVSTGNNFATVLLSVATAIVAIGVLMLFKKEIHA